MTAVGRSFPEGSRSAYATARFTAGRVLYLACDFTTPPKDKFVVVAASDDAPLLLVVNSKISDYINNRPYLRACQVELKATDHGFLTHDSFLNCTQTHDTMSREEILEQLVADPSRIKGELSTAARNGAVQAIRQTTAISESHKQRILAALIPPSPEKGAGC